MSGPPNGSTLTCSMTRANKLLAQLRESSSKSGERHTRRRFSSYTEPVTGNYHLEVDVLHFTGVDTLNTQLADMRSVFNGKLLKKRLVERWKNRLFELNIRYGIHTVLGNIDCLQQEKSMVSEALSAISDKRCISVNSLLVSMNAASTSDKKYDFKWNIGAFKQDDLNKRLKDISKELSKFDELKDKLNIENSFSIELLPEEMALLNI